MMHLTLFRLKYGLQSSTFYQRRIKNDASLSLGYPGRPIVSACNSSTDNISNYIDYVLKPLMESLPSYVKDTTHFIQKLKSFKLSHANSYFGDFGCVVFIH